MTAACHRGECWRRRLRYNLSSARRTPRAGITAVARARGAAHLVLRRRVDIVIVGNRGGIIAQREARGNYVRGTGGRRRQTLVRHRVKASSASFRRPVVRMLNIGADGWLRLFPWRRRRALSVIAVSRRFCSL